MKFVSPPEPHWRAVGGMVGGLTNFIFVWLADDCRFVRQIADSRNDIPKPEILKDSHHATQGPPGGIGLPSATIWSSEGKPTPLPASSIEGAVAL